MEDKNIAVLIKIASLEFNKHANRALAEYDLTISQYKIVKFILDAPDRTVRQIDLENYFYMTNPTVTGIVNNLEKKGLIERMKNPEDGRSNVLVPSERLKREEKEIVSAGDRMEKSFIECLNDEEQVQLKALLKKIVADKRSI